MLYVLKYIWPQDPNDMVYIFCAYRKWAITLFEKLSKKHKNIILVDSPKKLTYAFVKKHNPKFIFFLFFSWIVPENIVKNFRCVCIHESDLPKFRGGSPLQNQIIRGIKKTKSTAFLMSTGLDDGDIIQKMNLSLTDSIQDIFERMIDNDFKMIEKIIKGNFKTRKQTGRPTVFKRRTPQESELKSLDHQLSYLYDFIRMLDDPYPNAFVTIGKRRISFKNPKLVGNRLQFTGEIF